MKTSARGWLATVLASGLLMACSSDGGNTQPPADSGVTTDMGGATDGSAMDGTAGDGATTDRGNVDRPAPVDRGNLVAATCESATDISTMTPGSDGAIRVMGDNSTGAAVSLGNIGLAAMGGCINATMGVKGAVVVYRYTARTNGLITASTVNPGTDDPAFDTIVAILPACTATASPLGCSDDIGAAVGGAAHRYHSTATTRMPVTVGQMVYIVVGGFGASAKEASTGLFELSVREAPPIPIGMPCRVGEVCATGSVCLGATAMNSGLCAADGTAPGATCRLAAPFCDGALTCSVMTPSMGTRGLCRSQAAVGEACGTTAICTGMAFCPNFASTVPAGGGDAGAPADGGTGTTTRRLCAAPVMETEPNNTPAMPQAATTTTTVYRGSLSAGTDVDCYSVTVPAGATLYAETSDAAGGCDLGENEDTVLNVYRQGNATAIATNDDIADGYLCSGVAGPGTAALLRVAAGTYSICVSSYLEMGMGNPIAAYYLTVGVTPPAP